MMLRGTGMSMLLTRFSLPERLCSSSKTSTGVPRYTWQHGQARYSLLPPPSPLIAACIRPVLGVHPTVPVLGAQPGVVPQHKLTAGGMH